MMYLGYFHSVHKHFYLHRTALAKQRMKCPPMAHGYPEATIRLLVASILLCLWSSLAIAGETSDPFKTDAMLPLKTTLRIDAAIGDPCAESMPKEALNLQDVVNLALCNNPQTREAWASARAQAAQVGVSKAGYLPDSSLSASGERNWTGALTGVNRHNIGLSLSYLLYDFGARAANVENARQLLAAANASQDSTVQAVFLSAVQSFYQIQATFAALDAARESERAARESFAAAEARYTAGSATPADKLQAQTAYSQATLNRITANGNMQNARGSLANMIGLDANRDILLVAAGEFTPGSRSTLVTPGLSPQNTTTGETINRSTGIPKDGKPVAGYAGEETNDAYLDSETLKIFERDVSILIEEARQHRPDLQAAAAQVKAAEASADAVRAAGKPSVSLTASTNQSSTAGITSHGSSIGLNLSVPLFSGFASTYRIRTAEAQVDSKKAQLERLRLQVALDVWTAYQNLITATQTLRTTADLLNSAAQSERVALGRYKAGVGNMLDVLNAQSALASARQQRIQSMFDWNIGRATLAQAMGSLDESLLQTLPDARSKQPAINSQ